MDLEASDGHWPAWRFTIAGAAVVTAAFAFWIATNRAPAPGTPSPASSAIEASLQHYQAGRYEKAVAAAKTAIAANPTSAEAYNNLAVSYLQLKKFDDGLQAAREAIRLKPDFEMAKNNLAWIEREKAKASGAQVAAPAQPAPPADAVALLNQSVAHYAAGRFTQCIDTAAQSARLNPKSAQAFNNIGICAGKLERWDEAIRNTQEALRLDPNLQLAKNNLAWMQPQKLKSTQAGAR